MLLSRWLENLFQFLTVQLKDIENYKVIRWAYMFQFLTVQLKATKTGN